jgi:hypothetical protein
LQRELEKLDPDYDDCPLYCHDDELRPADSCAECPVTQANEAFRESCAELLKRRVFKEGESAWSLDTLVRSVEQVACLAVAAGETGQHESWTTTSTRLVAIFRHEQFKARRIDDWNREQERRNQK